MPNCFCLTKIGMTTPQKLQEVDDDMRRHFGAPADPEKWYKGWYDIIGFAIAMGVPVDTMRERLGPNAGEIIDWLTGNYEWNAWAERR